MTRMGPEALMVRWKTEPRADLALFAQFELARRDAREEEARILRELEYLPVTNTVSRRLRRWARGVFGDGAARTRVEGLRGERRATEPVVLATGLAPGRTLAAIPAARSGVRAEGAGTPISAAPVCLRS
jgi:hypothetical protein